VLDRYLSRYEVVAEAEKADRRSET
jgi:hypothetical protein